MNALGVGVIGLGWMGRVHTSAYRRVLEHYPDVPAPRLVVAADTSPARRAQAERAGFARTVADWRTVLDDPAVGAVSVTLPNALHREVGVAAAQAGKHLWIEKPVGRGPADTEAVADAVARAGVISAVGFCYRFAPAVVHARELVAAGALGDLTHVRAEFLCDYANRPEAAASWRFLRAEAGSGVLGDLMAHVADLTHALAGPITRLTGRTRTVIARRPAQPMGEGTHSVRVGHELVDVENEDWAGALVELAGGALGSLEASRVAVGPHAGLRIELQGTRGALAWEFERLNELRRFTLADTGEDEGWMRVTAGPRHGDFARFQPGTGTSMGYDDLRVIEAAHFLAAVRDGEQREPGLAEMVAAARVLAAIEASAASGEWEPAA